MRSISLPKAEFTACLHPKGLIPAGELVVQFPGRSPTVNEGSELVSQSDSAWQLTQALPHGRLSAC